MTPEKIDALEQLSIHIDIAGNDVEVLNEAIAELRVASEKIRKPIHYPECWDTAAYPTVEDALIEVYASFKCQECEPVKGQSKQVRCGGCDHRHDCKTRFDRAQRVPLKNMQQWYCADAEAR